MGKKLRNLVGVIERAAANLPKPVRALARMFVATLTWMLGSIVDARPDRPMIALSFDDGPDPTDTEPILDLLAERGAKASFFMLAERAEERPDLARKVIDQGHEACLHGRNHDNLTRLALREVVDRIRGGKQRLEAVLGSPVAHFRPPYGAQNLRSYLVTRSTRMVPVLWSASGDDWMNLPEAEVIERALSGLAPGGILLLHDGFEPNPDHPSDRPTYDKIRMLSGLLDAIEERGLQPTTVGQLVSGSRGRTRLWFEP